MANDTLARGPGKYHRKLPALRQPEPTELAWLAGLLEGEGSFVAAPRKNRSDHQLFVVMCSTDRDVIEKAHAVMNVGRITGPYNRGFKDTWWWRVSSHGAAMTVMAAVWPYMGERRQAQIVSSLTTWRAN